MIQGDAFRLKKIPEDIWNLVLENVQIVMLITQAKHLDKLLEDFKKIINQERYVTSNDDELNNLRKLRDYYHWKKLNYSVPNETDLLEKELIIETYNQIRKDYNALNRKKMIDPL